VCGGESELDSKSDLNNHSGPEVPGITPPHTDGLIPKRLRVKLPSEHLQDVNWPSREILSTGKLLEILRQQLDHLKPLQNVHVVEEGIPFRIQMA